MPSSRCLLAGAAALLVAAYLSPALAAGMFLAPRGVRPLGRAGAYVAGASDVNALSYNPAGLALAGNSVLVDFGYGVLGTDYTRRIDGGSPPLPTVHGTGLGIPSPTLGFTLAGVGRPEVSIGAAIAADYPLLQDWPCDLTGANPTPQRYAICNFAGTGMAKAGFGGSYRFDERLVLGAELELMLGSFATEMVTSNCDGTICTEAESPSYDAITQMTASGIVSPGVQLGVLYDALPWLRLGAALESGYYVVANAKLRIRLPTAAIYDNATLDPAEPSARVTLILPPSLRLGAEARFAGTRLEVDLVYEMWSLHDKITIDAKSAVVRDVVALGDYPLGKLTVDQGFRDSFGLRLGAESDLGLAVPGLFVRGGVVLERSAVPPEKLTAMTVDLNKVIPSLGASYTFGAWTLDAVAAYVYMPQTTVTNSTALQTNATRPPWGGRTAIGNGTYASRGEVFGLGVRYAW